MHGQQFARFEEELLRSAGQLNEIDHAAQSAADLDDVTAPNGARRDLDVGSHRESGCRVPHRVASLGLSWPFDA
ncbi:hypothetical protein BU197_29840 [Streptomyces sp. CBMA291]|nr:hypothetical protein [Streptomyces sp. CBMA291]MBD0716766.1 hypothetical protein [Streptomyces sp. CBMA370]